MIGSDIKGYLGRLNDRISIRSLLLIGIAIGVWVLAGRPIPPHPNDWPLYVWVFLLFSVVGAPFGWLIGKRIIKWLINIPKILIVDVDGGTGDLEAYELSEEKFADLTVRDVNGSISDKSELHRIQVSEYQQAFEVTEYDPESNVATASWMAGKSEIDIRKHESAVDDLIENLSPLADAYTDLRASQESIVREAVADIANYLIINLEKSDIPSGSALTDTIDEKVDLAIGEESGMPEPKPVEFSDSGGVDTGFEEVSGSEPRGSGTQTGDDKV